MSTIRRKLDEQVKKGRLREQCAQCQCPPEHHDQKERRCNLCWDPCVYTPAWIIRGS